MDMVKQILLLWKNRKNAKYPTLQNRLILFLALVVSSIILSFTMLLIFFGITGSGKQAVLRYLNSELRHISDAVNDDFSELSLAGIMLTETLSNQTDTFLDQNKLTAASLSSDPETLDELINLYMPTLISVADHNACGGVFVVLDPSSGNDSTNKTGFFIKKTQPVSSASLPSKMYCLRGSAEIAREYGIELLGQWQMKFDHTETDFYQPALDAARKNPHLGLSRLYFWSDRICLNKNSEEGLMLCLPLRSADKTLIGICGIEVSDRMFKQLYSPSENTYQGAFAIIAPSSSSVLSAQYGLIAGNFYLTGSHMSSPLSSPLEFSGTWRGFTLYNNDTNIYGGLSETLKIYPSGSPHSDQEWQISVLLPNRLLTEAIKGNSVYLFFIVAILLVVSLIACIFVSKRYLLPIQQGLTSIRKQAFETENAGFGILEIDILFEDMAHNIRLHKEEVAKLTNEKQTAQNALEKAQSDYEKAQIELSRLTYNRKKEVDPDNYQMFLKHLHFLTPTEREIFQFYLNGKSAKEILELLNIKENTLKYHNRNIYDKLGVSSRKELLRYATLMNQERVSQ